jgi:hypothetical protein
MDRATLKTWIIETQQSPMDDQSLEQYGAMTGKLNHQVLDAANARLRFEDEPAHIQRLFSGRPG